MASPGHAVDPSTAFGNPTNAERPGYSTLGLGDVAYCSGVASANVVVDDSGGGTTGNAWAVWVPSC